jgi:hypothetical protein
MSVKFFKKSYLMNIHFRLGTLVVVDAGGLLEGDADVVDKGSAGHSDFAINVGLLKLNYYRLQQSSLALSGF